MTVDTYSASEIAGMLACSRQAVIDWIRAGLLVGKSPSKRSKAYRITTSALKRFVTAHPSKVRWNRPGRLPLPWETEGKTRVNESGNRHRQWEAWQDAYLDSPLTDAQIALAVGRTVHSVVGRRHYLARKIGEWERVRHTYTPEEDAVIRACSNQEAAMKLGLSVGQVKMRRMRVK